MPSHENIISALRAATRDLHFQLEENLGLGRITSSRDSYIDVLKKFFAIWPGLESLLSESPISKDPEIELTKRFRSDRISEDLKALGENPETVPHHELPWSELSSSQAAGILYVLEGSTLGGKVISVHLKSNLDITPGSGGSFFIGHGENNPGMWSNYIDWANQNYTSPEEIDSACHSARTVFELFINLFSPSTADA